MRETINCKASEIQHEGVPASHSIEKEQPDGHSQQGQSQMGCTQRAVHCYLENLNGHETTTNDLYDLVIAETEKGLLTEVLDWCDGNQSKAAVLLGITRTTLRNKIRKLGL